MTQRMFNTHAFAMAQNLLELCSNILRPEDRQDAFEEFFRVCKTGLEQYEMERGRVQLRMRPLQN